MATDRSLSDLLFLFRDGQGPRTIGPDDWEYLIDTLHPATGTFEDLPASPGALAVGRMWQDQGFVKVALGGLSHSTLLGTFRGSGLGALAGFPRTRMRGSSLYSGRGSFASSASVVTAGPQPVFIDNFDSFDTNKWYANSYDEGGDAFWSNNPTDVADVFTYTGGKLNLAIINRPSGGKSLTSGIIDTYNPQFNGGTAFTQQYGYWEVTVAVDRYPGLLYEMEALSPVNFPPAFSLVRVWTDASSVQYVDQFLYDAPPIVSTDSNAVWDARQSHSYGTEWTATAVRFYRDRVLVGSFGNPGGPYTNGDAIYVKQHCNTNYSVAAGVTVDPAGLPKAAHVDSLRVWATRPF